MRQDIHCRLCLRGSYVACLCEVSHGEGVGKLIGNEFFIIRYGENGFTRIECRGNAVTAGGAFFSVSVVAVEKAVFL